MGGWLFVCGWSVGVEVGYLSERPGYKCLRFVDSTRRSKFC